MLNQSTTINTLIFHCPRKDDLHGTSSMCGVDVCEDRPSGKQLCSPSKYSDEPNPKRFQPSKTNITGKKCKL